MKKIIDIVQIALTMPDGLGYIASVLVVAMLWQVCKSMSEVMAFVVRSARFLRQRLIRITPARAAVLVIGAAPLYFLRWSVIDAIQYAEQALWPVYVTSDTSTHALAIYEAELARHVDAYELETIRRRTRDIAAKVGSTPLAIYEVAYSECGLNPYASNREGDAVGWIQFTRGGLPGITRADGRQATMTDVKDACSRRDIGAIMDWTEQYFVSRARGQPLPDATAVYVATFAPGYIGKTDSQVLYAGWNNPAYYRNAIFDGYTTGPGGRIWRRRTDKDGKITIGELRLHLEAKKSALINQAKK